MARSDSQSVKTLRIERFRSLKLTASETTVSVWPWISRVTVDFMICTDSRKWQRSVLLKPGWTSIR